MNTEVTPPSQPEEHYRAKPAFPRLWLIAVIVIATGIVVLFTITKLMGVPPGPTRQVVEPPEVSPTRPVRTLSTIATQSAFMALEQAHASLSASLTGTNLDDPSLSPPVLDLPLGFHQ